MLMSDERLPFDSDDDDGDDDDDDEETSFFTADHPIVVQKLEEQWRALDQVAAALLPGQVIGPDQRRAIAERVVEAWAGRITQFKGGHIDIAGHEARQARLAEEAPVLYAATRSKGALYLPRFLLPDHESGPWPLAITRAINDWLETDVADRNEFASEIFRRRLWTLQDQLNRLGDSLLWDPPDDDE
jgi:hypothetical protein